MSVRQRIAVVTGANRGIGFAIVRALCKRLHGTIYLTSRDEVRGRNAVNELETEGLHPKFYVLDVTNHKSIDSFNDYLVNKYGGVDVFIHNAGIAYKTADSAPFSEQARETVLTNFTSMVNLCHAFLPIMKSEGRFVTLSSMVAKMALRKCSPELQNFFKCADLTEKDLLMKMDEFVQAAEKDEHELKGFPSMAYGMSKLGVAAYTRIMGRKVQEMEQTNVLINCLCPGYVNTEMSNHRGTKTPDQGAQLPVYLSMLPEGTEQPNGEFYCKGRLDKWYS